MKIRKKILSIVISMFFIISLCTNVFADDELKEYIFANGKTTNSDFYMLSVGTAGATTYDQFQDKIYDAHIKDSIDPQWESHVIDATNYINSLNYEDLADDNDEYLLKYTYKMLEKGINLTIDAATGNNTGDLYHEPADIIVSDGNNKTIEEIIEDIYAARQKIHAAISYKGTSDSLKINKATKFVATDGNEISVKDDDNTKILYSQAQINKYLEMFGTEGLADNIITAWKARKRTINDNCINDYIYSYTGGKTLDEIEKEAEKNTTYGKFKYEHPKVSETDTNIDIDETINRADDFIKTKDDNNPNNNINTSDLSGFFNPIYNIALVIGIIIAVIVGAVLGIKFMTGSVEQKADTKKLLIPYVVGCVVIFGAFGIWKLVVTILAEI